MDDRRNNDIRSPYELKFNEQECRLWEPNEKSKTETEILFDLRQSPGVEVIVHITYIDLFAMIYPRGDFALAQINF